MEDQKNIKRSSGNAEKGVHPVRGMENKAASTTREISSWVTIANQKSLQSISRGSRPMAPSAFGKAISLKSKLLAKVARSRQSAGPFWALSLHFLPMSPNYCVGLVVAKVSHGMDLGYCQDRCMGQPAKTIFVYCRADAFNVPSVHSSFVALSSVFLSICSFSLIQHVFISY